MPWKVIIEDFESLRQYVELMIVKSYNLCVLSSTLKDMSVILDTYYKDGKVKVDIKKVVG